MDRIDRNILALLLADGRMSLTDLAAQVRLSVSSCHRRLKGLENTGVIVGYRALVNPRAMGLDFEALVFISMHSTARETVVAFEEAVVEIPNVVQTQRLFSEPDYLLHVIAKDLTSFQELYDEKLSALPGVRRLTSTLVMKDVIEHRSPSLM